MKEVISSDFCLGSECVIVWGYHLLQRIWATMHFSLSDWLQMTVCQQGLYLVMDFRALCPQRAWGVCMWGDDKEQGKYCLCGLDWVQQCATWELLEGLKRMQLKPLVIFPSNVFSWRNCLLISRHPGNLLSVSFCFFHSILLLLL